MHLSILQSLRNVITCGSQVGLCPPITAVTLHAHCISYFIGHISCTDIDCVDILLLFAVSKIYFYTELLKL